MAGSEGLSRAEKQHLSSPVEEASVFCRNWKEYYAAPECSVDLTFVPYSSAVLLCRHDRIRNNRAGQSTPAIAQELPPQGQGCAQMGRPGLDTPLPAGLTDHRRVTKPGRRAARAHYPQKPLTAFRIELLRVGSARLNNTPGISAAPQEDIIMPFTTAEFTRGATVARRRKQRLDTKGARRTRIARR